MKKLNTKSESPPESNPLSREQWRQRFLPLIVSSIAFIALSLKFQPSVTLNSLFIAGLFVVLFALPFVLVFGYGPIIFRYVLVCSIYLAIMRFGKSDFVEMFSDVMPMLLICCALLYFFLWIVGLRIEHTSSRTVTNRERPQHKDSKVPHYLINLFQIGLMIPATIQLSTTFSNEGWPEFDTDEIGIVLYWVSSNAVAMLAALSEKRATIYIVLGFLSGIILLHILDDYARGFDKMWLMSIYTECAVFYSALRAIGFRSVRKRIHIGGEA